MHALPFMHAATGAHCHPSCISPPSVDFFPTRVPRAARDWRGQRALSLFCCLQPYYLFTLVSLGRGQCLFLGSDSLGHHFHVSCCGRQINVPMEPLQQPMRQKVLCSLFPDVATKVWRDSSTGLGSLSIIPQSGTQA